MERRQHRTIARRVEELVRVPTRRQRASLRLAVSDHTAHQQIRVVKCSAESVHEGIAEFATLVDRAGCLWRHMARNPTRERELAKQSPQSLLVESHPGVDLAV